MTRDRLLILILITVLLLLFTALLFSAVPRLQAQVPPDVIKGYAVAIEPQTDGALKMKYDFSYCATTDFPSAQFDAGVPNSNFELLEAGPSEMVASAAPYTSGGSWVRFQFTHVPKAGECFKFYFTILQHQMAYPGETGVSFIFTPGWFDFAKIDVLRISWRLPDDVSLVRGFDPAPVSQEAGVAVWEASNLAPDQKFTVKLMVDKSAFGELAEPASAPAVSTSQDGGGNGGFELLILVVVVIVVVLVILIIVAIIISFSDGGGYSSGGYIGGHSSPSYSSPVRSSGSSSGRSSGGSSSGRSGGGSGNFGGRGSSCACVSCACACACAGGSRVGCSERGFDISRLLKKKC